MEERNKTLESLMVGAGAAMVALTSFAIVSIMSSFEAIPKQDLREIFLMILTSGCGTIFVLSRLHADLQQHYAALSDRENSAMEEARSDALTGLPNRKALMEELGKAIDTASANPSGNCLVILDLDQFKNVNDTLGHESGDELLRMVADRLNSYSGEHGIFRLGGDEFALLLRACDLRLADGICREICAHLVGLYDLHGSQASIGCSMGIAKIQEGVSASDLMRRADLAMYKAKNSRNSVALFDEAMLEEMNRKTALAIKLRESLETKTNISAKFQPIFSRDSSIVALEALFRWHDNEFGAINPTEAILIARSNRLLDQISLFVAEASCKEVSSLRNIVLCLNVEATQLLDTHFSEELEKRLRTAGLANNRIQLEISEPDFVEYGLKMAPILSSLVANGFRIAVDDFDLSNSSLTQLRSFGVSVLKFHHSVLQAAREANSIAVLRAKVNLAHSLGMTVTCKGIADDLDESIALQAGCEMLQGFKYGQPHSIGAFNNNFEISKIAVNE